MVTRFTLSAHCIDYCISKISVRAFECVYTSTTTRSSSDPNMLNIGTARTKSYGELAFAYQGLIIWNRVPDSIKIVEEKETFKRHLKTALFSRQD